MMQSFQASGRLLDAEATDEIRSRLVEMMTMHLDDFNRALLKKHGRSRTRWCKSCWARRTRRRFACR